MEEYYNLLNNKIKYKVYMVEINEYKYFLEEEKKEIDRINIIYNKLKMDLNIRNDIRKILLKKESEENGNKETYEYKFDKMYYINLEKSKERRDKMEATDFKLKKHRFEAIYNEDGDIGCGMSHCKLLNEIHSNSEIENEYFMILEDDIVINNEKYDHFMENIHNVIKNNLPDMIILNGSNRVIAKDKYYGNGFYKLLYTNTTCSYIIKNKYIPILLEKFNKGLSKLRILDSYQEELNIDSNIISEIKSYRKNLYCIDQIMNDGIEKENWITHSDSDIIKVDLNLISTITNKYLNKEKYEILDKLYKTIYPWSIKYNILNNIRFNIGIFLIKKIIKEINEDVLKY